MGKALNQMLTLGMVVVAVIAFVYMIKNPNVKNLFTGLLNQLKGVGGGQQQLLLPVQQQPAAGPGPITPATPPRRDFTGRSTGPGTRSQDPVTQAINRCVGVGVMPPDPQAYRDCVNMAYPKASMARIRIGIA